MSSQEQSEETKKDGSPVDVRNFLMKAAIRNGAFSGKKGYFVKVQLTSYRSLPLSCIEDIELKVDGKVIAPEDFTFVLNGFGIKLSEMADLSHIFWWILDPAELFVPDEQGLSEGEHTVEGTLVTVEPYMTAGRGSFAHNSTERLFVESEL